MWLAAKHLDPIMGCDQHLVLVPPGVPTPMPHPYVGHVFDPVDYVPFIGATVRINGLPAARAGTPGKTIVSHAPIHGPFAPPLPTDASELFMGSGSVITEGEPQARLGNLVLSCQSVGMTAPPRRKRQGREGQGLLPTSVVIPISAGPVVTVGGPAVVSLTALTNIVIKESAQRAAPGWTRRLLRMKGVATRIGRAIARHPKLAGHALAVVLEIGEQARNLIARALCTVTGHPVDVATGKVFTDKVDFELPGPIPLRWERV